MIKQKVYLETTLFNFYIDESRGKYHADTVSLFEEIAAGKYDAYTSGFVIEELEEADKEKCDMMLGLIPKYGITILPKNDEADRLADIYIAEGMIPKKYRMDAVHIAYATVNDLDTIISLNFEHIVKRKTIIMTEAINIMNGHHAVEIYSPAEVVEYEEKDRSY